MTEKVHKTPEETEQQAFLKGFEDEHAATGRAAQPSATTAEKPTHATSEAPKNRETKPEAKREPAKPAAAKATDDFVRLPKSEYETLKANAGKVPELEKRIESAFGKFGPTQQTINELKATVERLVASTPKGEAVELPADVVSELEAEFGDTKLPGGVKAALTKALKGLIGTGKKDASPDDAINTKVEERLLARAFEDLEEIHPNWKEIVGFAAPGQADPKNAFRAWLAKQPQEYQDKINNTRNPMVTANAITKFQVSQRAASSPSPSVKKPVVKAKAKKPIDRRNRIQGSVQPKGLGSPPPAQKQSAEDAFAEGFSRG